MEGNDDEGCDEQDQEKGHGESEEEGGKEQEEQMPKHGYLAREPIP